MLRKCCHRHGSIESEWDLGRQLHRVWHLTNLIPQSGNDSTANANDISVANGAASSQGIIGGAASFNGAAGNWIDFVNNGSLNNWNQQTISLWFKAPNGGMGSYARLIEKGYNNEWTAVWNYTIGNGITVQQLGGTAGLLASNAAVADNNWHKFDLSITSGNVLSLYSDGILNGTAQSPGPATRSAGLRLGAFGGGGNFYNGLIDELRISNNVRSADWIATEYNNESSPAAFYVVGQESTPACQP